MNTLDEIRSNNKGKKTKDELPFAIFVSPSTSEDEREDYKHVFTDIISDRIQQKYKQKSRTKFRKNIENLFAI